MRPEGNAGEGLALVAEEVLAGSRCVVNFVLASEQGSQVFVAHPIASYLRRVCMNQISRLDVWFSRLSLSHGNNHIQVRISRLISPTCFYRCSKRDRFCGISTIGCFLSQRLKNTCCSSLPLTTARYPLLTAA